MESPVLSDREGIRRSHGCAGVAEHLFQPAGRADRQHSPKCLQHILPQWDRCSGVGELHDPQIWRVKQGDSDGSRKAFGFETGDIQGAYGVFVEKEAVVDDPDDRGAHPFWSSSHLYSEFSRGSFHIYSFLVGDDDL